MNEWKYSISYTQSRKNIQNLCDNRKKNKISFYFRQVMLIRPEMIGKDLQIALDFESYCLLIPFIGAKTVKF